MNKVFLISFLILVLFASCEKNADQTYTLKFYGDAYEDIGYSVTIVTDGYVIAGQVEDIIRDGNYISGSNKNMGIIKTGWDGNVTWKRSMGGKFDDRGSKIYQDPDGSLICVGTFTDTTTLIPVQTDVYVVKVSASGTIEWQKHYGGAGNQTGKDIVKTPDGYMILGSTNVGREPVTASTGNTSGKTDIFLLKINAVGDSLESFAYGYPGNDVGVTIKPDLGGNFIVFGTTDMSNPDQDKNNMLLVKINPVGYTTEPVIIGEKKDEYAADLEVLADGYLIAGTIIKDDGNQEIFVSKLKNDIYADPYFTPPITITGSNSAGVYALTKYRTNSFLLAGYSGTGLSTRMLVFELDAEGNQVEGHQMIKGSSGTQVAYDVVSGDDEYIIAVGKNSYDVNSMITFLKFRF